MIRISTIQLTTYVVRILWGKEPLRYEFSFLRAPPLLWQWLPLAAVAAALTTETETEVVVFSSLHLWAHRLREEEIEEVCRVPSCTRVAVCFFILAPRESSHMCFVVLCTINASTHVYDLHDCGEWSLSRKTLTCLLWRLSILKAETENALLANIGRTHCMQII